MNLNWEHWASDLMTAQCCRCKVISCSKRWLAAIQYIAEISWQFSGSWKPSAKNALTARLMVVPSGTAPAGTVSQKPLPGHLMDWCLPPVISSTVDASSSNTGPAQDSVLEKDHKEAGRETCSHNHMVVHCDLFVHLLYKCVHMCKCKHTFSCW